MLKAEAIGSSASLIVAASVAAQHAVEVGLQHVGVPPITPEECFYSLGGGLIGAIILEFGMHREVKLTIAKFVSVLTTTLAAFAFGPALANLAAYELAFVGQGSFENIMAGAFVTLVCVPLYRLLIAIIEAVQQSPDGSADFAVKLFASLKEIWKK